MSMANRTSFAVDHVNEDNTCYWHHQPDGGRITVVDRLTGFGYRDIETGYRCPSGQFWLASGGCDIRTELHLLDSDQAMAEWVIERANNCNGGHHPWQKVGASLDWLLSRHNWKPSQSEAKP